MEPKPIRTRDDLIELISDVVCNYDANGERWENRDIRSFLEAIGAWLEDCDGYYQNNGDSRDVDSADWQIFADAIAAARIYE